MPGFLSRFSTLSRISMVPPKGLAGRHGLAIVAIVKNESRYIGEWASFHYRAGVRKFYIYDNGSTDETVAVLRECLPDDSLVITPWNQKIGNARFKNSVIDNQILAYSHAISNYGGDFSWVACIDIDEFIVPIKESTIVEALEKIPNQGNISLPWHMYGTSGHDRSPKGSVIENYTFRYKTPLADNPLLRNFKCIIDPCNVNVIRCHSYMTNGLWKTVNDVGKESDISSRTLPGFYSAENLQLNHYYTRSKEEFGQKIDKGRMIDGRSNRYASKANKILTVIDSDVVEDLCAIDYLNRVGAS